MTQEMCSEKVRPNTSGRNAPCILTAEHEGEHRISISQWLTDLGSHEIYIADTIGEDFTRWTGELPCWPIHTAKTTRQAIRTRGLGGTLETEANTA